MNLLENHYAPPDTAERPLREEIVSPASHSGEAVSVPYWVTNAMVLWEHRRSLLRFFVIALVVSLIIAFTLPKRYASVARIMPPDQGGGGAALAALLGRAGGGSGGGLGELGGLAGDLLGVRNTSALFVDMLRSGTVSAHLIDRFHLQDVYHKRYRIDTAKLLARRTSIVDDKKSGVITLKVEDTDPRRARDLAQGYLLELNSLLTHTNTSSAHQERVFLEHRLRGVQSELEKAQLALSNFSSTHDTIDVKEQIRATVDAAARLEGELVVGQSEVDSLRQIYGDGNVRVRAAQARVADLQHAIVKISGTSAPLPSDDPGSAASSNDKELYPPLRQLPRLAVPYADLYRRVRVEETVFELLTQEYELSRIQEAKDVPIVSVLDQPGIAEKKSFPPRLLVTLLLTTLAFAAYCAFLLLRFRWEAVDDADPRKRLGREIAETLRSSLPHRRAKGAQ